MTQSQTLLYAAPSDITIERVRALVRQVGPEAPMVEYKEQMCDTIAKGVVGLANAYGGLLLVGVTDDRQVRGVKEKTIEAVAEHCQARIEPPWVPEIIPVPMGQGSDLYVLALRVIPGQHVRPLFADGVPWERHHNTSHPASWHRVRDLYAEQPADDDTVWNIQAPNLPHSADGQVDETLDFVLRSGLVLPVARETRWRPLSERSVAAFAAALDESSLARRMRSLAVGAAGSGHSTLFRRQGLNRAHQARLGWSAAPEGWPGDLTKPVQAVTTLKAPGGYGDISARLSVEIDVEVHKSAAIEIMRSRGDTPAASEWLVPPRDLFELIEAILETLSSDAVVQPLAGLAGIDPVVVPRPRILHMVAARPMTRVLYTAGLNLIPDAGTSHGAHLVADPALDFREEADRRRQAAAWLTDIALDAGLLGMEKLVAQILPQQPPGAADVPAQR